MIKVFNQAFINNYTINKQMKKILVLNILLSWCTITAFSQYTSPGTGVVWDLDDLVNNSGGAVTEDGGVYLINEDLSIISPDTIRLVDNAVLKFEAEKLITISGVFEANPPDSIVFSAIDTLSTYKSFRFEDSDFSSLINCVVEFGGGIDILNSDMAFMNCTFRKNDKSNSTGVIDLFFSNPMIIDCKFYYNEGPAVLSGANSECSPLIQGNLIYRNNTANSNMPQINLGTSSPGIPIEIVNNTITGYYDKAGGIAVTTLAGGELDCIIDGNSISNNRYGITAYGFDISSVISNNTIYDNNIENLPMVGGSGINYWGGTSNASMVYGNEIHGNLWGITVTGDALPNFGQVINDTVNVGLNRIYDNGNLGITYALYNNTPNDIFAQNNFWGSYNLDSVEMVIFHQPDDETLGLVDYLPIGDTLVTQLDGVMMHDAPFLFPNPADSYLTVQIPEDFTTANELSVTLLNMNGQEVKQMKINDSLIKIDLAGIVPGLYFIEISDHIHRITTKFIKQ